MPKPATESAQRIGRWMRDLALARHGSVFSDGTDLWWLIGPFDPPGDPLGLAHEVLATGGLDVGRFAPAIGARGTVRLDDAQLSRWWRSLARVRGYEAVAEKYRLDGLPALRAFREHPISEFVEAIERRLQTFRAILDQSVDGSWIDPATGIDGRGVDKMSGAALHRRLSAVAGQRTTAMHAALGAPTPAAQLALQLLYGDADIRIPASSQVDPSDAVAFAVAAGSRTRCEELWSDYLVPLFGSTGPVDPPTEQPHPVGHAPRWFAGWTEPRRWRSDRLAASAVAATDLLTLARYRLIGTGEQFAADPNRVRSLASIAPLIEEHSIRDEASRILGGPRWAEGLVGLILGVLVSSSSADQRLVGQIQALAAALPTAASPLEVALRQWANPLLDLEQQRLAGSVAEVLGIDRQMAEQFLGYRLIVGEPATFSQAILRVFDHQQAEARETAWLRTLSNTSGGLSTAQAARLTNLDTGQAACRLAAARSAAVHTLRRNVESLRSRALLQLLDEVLVDLARHRLGITVTGAITPAARAALLLMLRIVPEAVDKAANRRLVTALLHGENPVPTRQAVAWRKRAAQHFDVDRWQAGFSTPANIRGQQVIIAVEGDPLEVLRMGSYFDTCLSLEDGFNALSVIANLADVNKSVVYVRRQNGTVLGRKLIGITATGDIAGYRTYAHGFRGEILDACRNAIARFADSIGATLSDTVTPERLGGFWYDDGNEPWSGPVDDDPEDAEDAEPLETLLRRGDKVGITQLAGQDSADGALAGVWLARHGISEFAGPNRDEIARFLVLVGELDTALAVDSRTVRAGDVTPCPVPTVAQDFVDRLGPRRRAAYSTNWVRFASVALALRTGDLIEALTEFGEHPDFVDDATADFFVAATQRRDGARLRRFVASKESRAAAAGACCPVPEARQRLRAILGQPQHPLTDFAARGLGRLANPQDADLLVGRLIRRPQSLELAYAATRCGASAMARELWRPALAGLLDHSAPEWRFAAARRIAKGELGSLTAAIHSAVGDARSDWQRSDVARLAAKLGLRDVRPSDLVPASDSWMDESWRKAHAASDALDGVWIDDRVILLGEIFDPDAAHDAAMACADGTAAEALCAARYLANVAPAAHALALVGLHAMIRRWPPHVDSTIDAAIAKLGLAAVELGSPSALHLIWLLADRGVPGLAGELVARLFRIDAYVDPDIAFDSRPTAVDALARLSDDDRAAFARALGCLPHRVADDPRLGQARQLIGALWEIADVELFDARLKSLPEV